MEEDAMTTQAGSGNDNTNANGQQTDGTPPADPNKVVDGATGGAGGTPPADAGNGAPADGTAGDPGSWTFEMPEGMSVDEGSLNSFREIAKEAGLTKEVADKLIALEVQRTQAIADAHDAMVAGWVDEMSSDPELGGEKLGETLATARKVIDALQMPELPKLLDETGYGNHPVLVRAFYKLGKMISEHSFERGAPTGDPAQGTDAAKKLFPNMA